MNIIKILKTNGKLFEGNIEESKNHYYVFFKCERCGTLAKKQKRRININGFYCSKCLSVERHHSEETKKKIGKASKKNNNIQLMKKSLMSSEGVDNASKIPSVVKKREQTNLEKYGGNAPACSEEIKEKIKQTNLEKYGVKFHSQTEQSKKIKRDKNFLKSLEFIKEKGFTPLFSIEEFKGKTSDFSYKWKCNKCNTEFENKIYDSKVLPRCPKCNPFIKGISKGELEMKDYINESEKYRDKYEIDAYIKDKKIGFEFDGLYWHSDNFKESDYHLKKTEYFQSKGIRVYHIFEDEWNEKQEIIKSIINTKLNIYEKTIYGRKCIIKPVEVKDSIQFQNNNHIQGATESKVKIGLYYENELVSLMTFGKSRLDKNFGWELVRFVNKKNTKIIGGASKLFKYFRSNYKGSIISYSDERLFDGRLYKNLGFTFSHKTPPQYYYVRSGVRYNRMQFQKSYLKDKLKTFDPNLTEKENMINNGYHRIYDCGQKVWVL